jgi:hypothetical protein
MEITVKATLQLKEENTQESPVKPVAISTSQQRPVTGKKFTREPVLMKDIAKSLAAAKAN